MRKFEIRISKSDAEKSKVKIEHVGINQTETPWAGPVPCVLT